MSLSATITSDLKTLYDSDAAIDVSHSYSGNTETIRAFFDVKPQQAFSDAVIISEQETMIKVREATAGNITKDSTFTIESTVYNPWEIGPPVHGEIIIKLTEAAR